jgi:uncharacterized RDD family membrane protein YckC
MQIFLSRNGQQAGPLSMEQVRALVAQGRVTEQDWAWFEGAAGWMAVRDLPGWSAAAAATDAAPPAEPSASPSAVEASEEPAAHDEPTAAAYEEPAPAAYDDVPADPSPAAEEAGPMDYGAIELEPSPASGGWSSVDATDSTPSASSYGDAQQGGGYFDLQEPAEETSLSAAASDAPAPSLGGDDAGTYSPYASPSQHGGAEAHYSSAAETPPPLTEQPARPSSPSSYGGGYVPPSSGDAGGYAPPSSGSGYGQTGAGSGGYGSSTADSGGYSSSSGYVPPAAERPANAETPYAQPQPYGSQGYGQQGGYGQGQTYGPYGQPQGYAPPYGQPQPYGQGYGVAPYGAAGQVSLAPGNPATQYGGFWIRFAAAIIDNIVMWLPGAFAGGIIGTMYTDPTMMTIATFTTSILMNWLYDAVLTSSGWRGTVGKKLLGLQVVDSAGGTVSFARATGRYFGKILSGIPCAAGYIVAAFDPQKRTWHDLMADTYVVHK